MNWDDLKPFLALALAREGSLSGAARQLRVEHATIARRIDRLEADLGQRLFDRLPRGWRPTQDGIALVARAETVEAATFSLLRQAGGGSGGPVRLSAPPLLAAELLAPHLQPFLEAHPEIQLSVETSSSRVDLGRGETDLALRIGAIEGQTLRLRRIGDVIYRPYGHSADSGVIRAEPPLTEPERWMSDWSGVRPVVLNTSDSAVMREAASAGIGIALLPEFYSRGLTPVGETTLSRPLYLTLHEDKARSPRVRLVADAIAEIVGRQIRKIERT